MPLILAAPYFRRAIPGEIFVPAEYDPYFSQVTALLHFEGVEGSTALTDVKGNTWNNSSKLSTAQKKFGSMSALFTKTANQFATLNGNAAFGFGTGLFTIEGWVYFNSFTGTQGIFDPRASASNQMPYVYNDNGTARMKVGGSIAVSKADAFVLKKWHHVAFTRQVDGRIYFHVDGIAIMSYGVGTSLNFGTTGNLALGRDNFNADFLDGYMDEVRVTKGRARYPTSPFAVPTTPFDSTGLKVEGWQVAWYAKSDNLNSTTHTYDVALADIQKAKRAALAYYDSTQGGIVTPLNMYSFDIPESWKTQHPFSVASKDTIIDAKEEATGIITSGMLRHGYQSFNVLITDGWVVGSYGRIGITNTKAPFLSGFATATADSAALSNQQYAAGGPSTPTKRLMILIQ
jgi:hypothetical protein